MPYIFRKEHSMVCSLKLSKQLRIINDQVNCDIEHMYWCQILLCSSWGVRICDGQCKFSYLIFHDFFVGIWNVNEIMIYFKRGSGDIVFYSSFVFAWISPVHRRESIFFPFQPISGPSTPPKWLAEMGKEDLDMLQGNFIWWKTSSFLFFLRFLALYPAEWFC